MNEDIIFPLPLIYLIGAIFNKTSSISLDAFEMFAHSVLKIDGKTSTISFSKLNQQQQKMKKIVFVKLTSGKFIGKNLNETNCIKSLVSFRFSKT